MKPRSVVSQSDLPLPDCARSRPSHADLSARLAREPGSPVGLLPPPRYTQLSYLSKDAFPGWRPPPSGRSSCFEFGFRSGLNALSRRDCWQDRYIAVSARFPSSSVFIGSAHTARRRMAMGMRTGADEECANGRRRTENKSHRGALAHLLASASQNLRECVIRRRRFAGGENLPEGMACD